MVPEHVIGAIADPRAGEGDMVFRDRAGRNAQRTTASGLGGAVLTRIGLRPYQVSEAFCEEPQICWAAEAAGADEPARRTGDLDPEKAIDALLAGRGLAIDR